MRVGIQLLHESWTSPRNIQPLLHTVLRAVRIHTPFSCPSRDETGLEAALLPSSQT